MGILEFCEYQAIMDEKAEKMQREQRRQQAAAQTRNAYHR
jgi:hypothetical protein